MSEKAREIDVKCLANMHHISPIHNQLSELTLKVTQVSAHLLCPDLEAIESIYADLKRSLHLLSTLHKYKKYHVHAGVIIYHKVLKGQSAGAAIYIEK